MPEITIWLSAGCDLGELGGDVDRGIEDCPFWPGGAEGGDDSLVPPHATSTRANSSSNDEIEVTRRLMFVAFPSPALRRRLFDSV